METTEPETQTEDETLTSVTSDTSGFLGEVKTDTDTTEDATIKSSKKSADYKSTDRGSETEDGKKERRSVRGKSVGVKA